MQTIYDMISHTDVIFYCCNGGTSDEIGKGDTSSAGTFDSVSSSSAQTALGKQATGNTVGNSFASEK